MTYTEADYQKHLEEEHKVSPLSTYLREIVYGGTDGIVTTFAVVAGFTGANVDGNFVGLSVVAVLLFGLANLFADGVSMGLGNFLSIRAEKDVYKTHKLKEAHEIKNNREMELEETEHLLKERGFSEEDAKKLTQIFSKNEEYWVEFMMHHELEMPNPEGQNPVLTGIATFSAFVFFGFIPLIPYTFLNGIQSNFAFSVLSTIISLLLLGILRWRVTKERAIRSIFEILLVGGTSAIVAYIVGSFFNL